MIDLVSKDEIQILLDKYCPIDGVYDQEKTVEFVTKIRQLVVKKPFIPGPVTFE